jgi:hypothetical protein
MHSATKYLNGHSDMVGGIVVVGDDAEIAEKMTFLQNAVGGVQGPFDSFLALRGLKTLALRVERQNRSALEQLGCSLSGCWWRARPFPRSNPTGFRCAGGRIGLYVAENRVSIRGVRHWLSGAYRGRPLCR